MHTCPCCGEITYASDDPHELCPECLDAGCVITHDSTGEPGYWSCERLDIYDDYEYDDDSYDEYDDWRYSGPDYVEDR
jgi:hypothetical protein